MPTAPKTTWQQDLLLVQHILQQTFVMQHCEQCKQAHTAAGSSTAPPAVYIQRAHSLIQHLCLMQPA
jgi:hypothetical protein